MCNTTDQQTTTQPSPFDGQNTLDKELERSNLELKIAQAHASMEFNNSPAGLMQRQFETYQRIAMPLADSDFVPAAYRGKIGNCIMAVEMAARIGTFPLAVMQNLCIVKGNPTWKSKFLIGCVNTCGRYTSMDYRITINGKVGNIKYKYWEKDKDGKNRELFKPFENPGLDNLECVAFATEKATGKVLTSTPASIRMAIEEGWYTKDGSKWKTMPELMLRYRAASFWVSTYAPEMSMGLRTEEEQRDIVDTDFEDISDSLNSMSKDSRSKSVSIEQAKEKIRNRGKKVENDNAANKTFDMP